MYMKRSFMCASSCMCSPSYGCPVTPVVDGMCLYCEKKLFNYKKSIYWNKNEKHFLNEQKVGMLLQKEV